MQRWNGKVAVVTGASSGIGAAITIDLLKAGLTVVGLARRADRVEELRSKVPASVQGFLHPFKCDVAKEEDILAAFAWIEKTLGGVDILVNNAGVWVPGKLVDADNSELIRKQLDVNVLGLVLCAREAFRSMKARGVDGHVVLINSQAGHHIPHIPIVGSMNIYAPTKYAVTAITEVLRQEFIAEKTKTKVTSISPGAVLTEMVPEALKFNGKPQFPYVEAEDISAAVLYALGTPPHVQVHELSIRPVGELF